MRTNFIWNLKSGFDKPDLSFLWETDLFGSDNVRDDQRASYLVSIFDKPKATHDLAKWLYNTQPFGRKHYKI